MYAVVMKCRGGLPRQDRCAGAEPEGEAERLAEDATEPPAEYQIYDKVDERVDNHQ